jgi:putative tricarboxylic transport membrane protein
LTFCSFVDLGRECKHKTIISMSLGLLLAGVGMDTVSGQLRMTFGSEDLLRGINFLVAVIGLFGISEILLTMRSAWRCAAMPPRSACASCSMSGRICRNTG